jgi:hypothetical protein
VAPSHESLNDRKEERDVATALEHRKEEFAHRPLLARCVALYQKRGQFGMVRVQLRIPSLVLDLS